MYNKLNLHITLFSLTFDIEKERHFPKKGILKCVRLLKFFSNTLFDTGRKNVSRDFLNE